MSGKITPLAYQVPAFLLTGRKTEPALAYGQVKYIGALWMASLVRQHPDGRLVTVSPGNTSGTDGPNSLPRPPRLDGSSW